MNDYIPFVQTDKDCEILTKLYSDATAARLSVQSSSKTISQIPAGMARWVDAGIDAIDHGPAITPDYSQYLKQYSHINDLLSPPFQSKPSKQIAAEFVESVLDKCNSLQPSWISVPQLPQVSGSERNRINRLLAESSQMWKAKVSFKGKFILPVIFTHQQQIRLKTDRNKKIALIKECFLTSGADGIWVAESSLSDQDGSNTFDTSRFPSLVHFHDELLSAVNPIMSIAGPYWGINLVLWAKGLVTHPAIGLGNSYQYHIPGSVIKGGKTRVALGPLRRWAVASLQLKSWIEKSLTKIPSGDPAHAQLTQLLKAWDKVNVQSRLQVAAFYKQWFETIASVPQVGRSLGLYQDLSSAYVLGKSLEQLPKDEGAGRRPEKVAQQFMLRCL